MRDEDTQTYKNYKPLFHNTDSNKRFVRPLSFLKHLLILFIQFDKYLIH